MALSDHRVPSNTGVPRQVWPRPRDEWDRRGLTSLPGAVGAAWEPAMSSERLLESMLLQMAADSSGWPMSPVQWATARAT